MANIFSKEDYICHIQIRFEMKRERKGLGIMFQNWEKKN